MRRFFINFRNSARDRASQISNRAYNRLWRIKSLMIQSSATQHYLRIRPIVDKIKLRFNKYGQGKEGIKFPRKT